MSLKAKIKGAVDKAFSAAGDLVLTGSLQDTKATSYDFASGTTTSTTKSISVQIIFLDTKKSTDSAYAVNAIIKSGPSLDGYDKIVVAGKTYGIVDFSDNGFAVEITLKKEA